MIIFLRVTRFFLLTEWARNFSSAKRSSRITLSPSYTKSEFSSSIGLIAWPYNGKIVVEIFRKEIFNEVEEIASLEAMGPRNNTLPSIF